MENYIKKSLLELKKKLSCDFAITGSLAIRILGVSFENIKANDIDLILFHPTKEDIEFLTYLSDLAPNPNYFEINKYNWEVKHQFKLGDICFDIFYGELHQNIKYKINYPSLNLDGVTIYLNPFSEILKAKKRFNRKKDWNFIFKLIDELKSGFNILDIKEGKRNEFID
jgi:hypothetical protein